MAIKEHMKEWKCEHYNGYCISLNDIKWMGDVSGNKDTYPWDDQKRPFYLDYLFYRHLLHLFDLYYDILFDLIFPIYITISCRLRRAFLYKRSSSGRIVE